MDLKTYLSALDAEKREAFASRCGTTAGHLQNIMYGVRPCAPALAVLIESNSGFSVRRWDLRANDWHLIWPELKKSKGAPEFVAADIVTPTYTGPDRRAAKARA